MTTTRQDIRQSILRSALSMIGSAANATGATILPLIDAELAKLFEDRNVMLTDGGLITFTGTQLQFTENLKITLNQKVSGAVPQVIDLGNSNQNFTTSGDMWVAVINRSAGTATSSIITAGNPLPAVTSANQEVFLLAKRVDATDGTQRIYWRNGFAQNAGQTLRLGQGGGSGGNGTGDDLTSLNFLADFTDLFDEGPTDTKSAVDSTAGHTPAANYSAAKSLYLINYDASKTIAATTTATNIKLSATPAYTVAVGDMVIWNGLARRITTVNTQTDLIVDTFGVAPTVGNQVTVSQCVYTKDIYNLAVDGVAISAAFSSAFSEILVDYEDTTTVNDNIFDINTAPVVAFSASADGTSYSAVTARPTSVTTQVQSLDLPSSGTSLYIRFFAYKTSGSGSVNILRYKAYMQKSLTATAGGVINAAYGFTNGTGTEYQSTLGVSGGKTTITLTNWTYAVGVATGSPYGSIDVYLNGQLIPRFIDSTTTPDAYYTETNPSVITLDKDYSGQAISYEILQRVQIVDNSETNTSKITSLQRIVGQSVKDFVDMSNSLVATSTVGTPAAGTFYSSIVNRAPISDLTQDMKVRFGSERVMIAQALQRQDNEIGPGSYPNQQAVWSTPNDLMGRVRFVGNWNTSTTGVAGYAAFTLIQDDFVEFTFYGTGLNLLDQVDGSARSYAVSVDGGSETILTVTSPSSVLNNLNYGMNIRRNMVSGLTLGVHTVKIRNNGGSAALTLFGYEVLQSASTLIVNPGNSYVAGQQITLASQVTPAYNSSFESGTLGSRGGRVLVYQKADGSVGKAVQPTNTSQQNTSAADHTNEEIANIYHWREFGAGRTDDFASLAGTSASKVWTLDDGHTSLIASAVQTGSGTLADSLSFAGAASFIEIHFVGTGLDIQNVRGATITDSYTINVDGTAIVTNTLGSTLFGAGQLNIAKIVSGLKYGSHTVRITCSTSVGVGLNLLKFIVYQPKTPSLPSGAIELARYNILGDYTANATGGQQTIGQGILRTNSQREFQYSGTWSLSGVNTGNIGGKTVSTSTNGDSMRYVFIGTGCEVRWASTGTSYQFTIQVDGATNFTTSNASPTGGVGWTGALTTSSYGTGSSSFTPSTGVVVSTTTAISGNGVQLSGMTYGLHTIVLTKSSAAATTFVPEAIDVIAPAHSHKESKYITFQGALRVGANNVSDTRTFSPLIEPVTSQKAYAQAFGITSSPTTTSTALVPMPDMSCTIKTNGGPLKISYSAGVHNSVAGQNVQTAISLNGVQIGPGKQTNTGAGQVTYMADYVIVPVPAGTHTVVIFWAVSANTGTAFSTQRELLVEEK